jgi:predicted nucleic-acid-binding Zn-ribbon protein
LGITLTSPDAKAKNGILLGRVLMIQCQECGSENVQKLSVVYDGGFSDINAKEGGVGIGFGSGGIGLGIGSSKIKGSHQSRLSQKAAPPTKKRIVKHFALWGIGLFIVPPLVVSILGWDSSFAQLLIFVSYLGAAGLHIYSDIQYNQRVFPKLLGRWNASYFCHKCGITFLFSVSSSSGSGVMDALK